MTSLVDRNGAPLRICQHPDCNRRAEVYPQLIIPPVDLPIERGLPITLGLTLCRRHGLEEKPETFLTEEFKERARRLVGSKSPVPLDFGRSRIKLGTLGDDGWQKFTAISQQGRQGRKLH